MFDIIKKGRAKILSVINQTQWNSSKKIKKIGPEDQQGKHHIQK